MPALLSAHLKRGKGGRPALQGVTRAGLLTNHREQQQDAADDNGHNDGGLTAAQLECGNGLVEVAYLDLHKDRGGVVASKDLCPGSSAVWPGASDLAQR